MFIYVITNDVNDKAYVGLYSGGDLRIRWRRHKSAARGSSKTAIHRAMRKYGIEKFHITAIWSGHFFGDNLKSALNKLGELEKYYIRCLRTKCPNGYNAADGGTINCGFKHSKGTIEKLKGKIFSEETRSRMREARKGMKLSESHRLKISNSLLGNTRNKGYVQSEETRRKIGIAVTGRTCSEETREKLRRLSDDPVYREKNITQLREASKKRLPIVWSDESKAKVSAALKGRRLSEEEVKERKARFQNTEYRNKNIEQLRVAQNKRWGR